MEEQAAQEQPAVTVKSLSGFDEGTVLPDGSKVMGSYDDDKNLVGWHKEPPTSAGGAS